MFMACQYLTDTGHKVKQPKMGKEDDSGPNENEEAVRQSDHYKGSKDHT